MPRELRVEKLNKKFSLLTKSKDSIQSLSLWIIYHKAFRDEISQQWLKAVQKADASHTLTLFYLANDVLQNCKRRGAVDFRTSFSEVLEDAVGYAKDKEIKDEVLRMIAIWTERNVFSTTFLKSLETKVKTKNDPPVVQIVEDSPQQRDVDMLESFDPRDLLTCLEQIAKPQKDASESLKSGDALNESEISQLNLLDIRINSNMPKMYKKLERTEKLLEDYLGEMQKEIMRKNDIIKVLEISKLFYTKQNEDVRRVAQAYRIFGKKLRMVKDALEEKKKLLPPSEKISTPPPPPSPEKMTGMKGVQSPVKKSIVEANEAIKDKHATPSTTLSEPKQKAKNVKLSESKQKAKSIKPSVKAAELKQTVQDIKPSTSAAVVEPKENVEDIKSPINIVVTEPKLDAKDVKRITNTAVVEPKQKAKDMKPITNTAAVEPKQKAKDIKPFTSAVETEVKQKAEDIRPSVGAAGSEPKPKVSNVNSPNATVIVPKLKDTVASPNTSAVEPELKSADTRSLSMGVIELEEKSIGTQPNVDVKVVKPKHQKITLKLKSLSIDTQPQTPSQVSSFPVSVVDDKKTTVVDMKVLSSLISSAGKAVETATTTEKPEEILVPSSLPSTNETESLETVCSEENIKMDDSVSIVNVDDSDSSVKMDDSDSNVKMDDGDSNVKMDDSESNVKMDDSESNVKMDDSDSNVKMDDNEFSVKMDDIDSSEKVPIASNDVSENIICDKVTLSKTLPNVDGEKTCEKSSLLEKIEELVAKNAFAKTEEIIEETIGAEDMEISSESQPLKTELEKQPKDSDADVIPKGKQSTEKCLLQSMKMMNLLLKTKKEKSIVCDETKLPMQKALFPLNTVFKILRHGLNKVDDKKNVTVNQETDVSKNEQNVISIKDSQSKRRLSNSNRTDSCSTKSPKVDTNLELMDMDLDSEGEN